jgi:hypothetical protein
MTSIFDTCLFLTLFQIKHYLGDFQLQTGWIARNKGRYGHPSGIVHAGVHGALSLPILLWFAVPWEMALGLALAEIVVHYHIDWAKARRVVQEGVTETDPRFWHYLGLDQAAHQLTYIALLAVVASRAA